MAEEKNLWEDESTIPQSNWFTFEKIGDFVQGELLEVYDRESKFGMQKVFCVKVQATSNKEIKEGDEVNVSLKHTTHKMNILQLKGAEVGDVVGFKLKELVDTGKVNPAKSLEVRLRHTNKQ